MTKRILIAITAVLLASTLTTLNKQEEYNPDNIPTHIHAKFLNWRMTFNKMYNTPREYIYRVQIFYENYLKFKEIMQDNSLLYKAELNKFADLSKEEFLSKWGGYMRTYRFSNSEKVEEYTGKEITSIPRKIDWREKNCVTEISNQNNCASSWAFSTAAILECYYYKKEDQLYKLSPQQMIDCIDTSENYGCKGGKPETGLNYAKEKKFVWSLSILTLEKQRNAKI